MRTHLFAALIVAAAVAGCSEGSPPLGPSPSPPSTHVALASTQTPPAPQASATPPRTRMPAASVTFHFDAVAADDQALIRAGIEIASTYLQEGAGIEAPRVDVFAGSDTRRLALQFLDFTKSPVFQGSNFMLRIASGVAEANLGSVFVFTEAPIWKSSNAVQRVRVVAHEFTHVVQFELMGDGLARRFFSREAGEAQAEGPTWLLEGTADLVSWRAMQDAGLTVLEDHLRGEGAPLAGSDLHPRTMETFIDYLAGGPDSIEVSLLAAELLLRGKGEGPLRLYFERLRGGAPWQQAFVEAFGETPEAFYRRFDEYKRAGFRRG